MAWTEITRARYRREGLRYASDLTDAEWGLVEPLLPLPRRWGRPRVVDLRAVLDGLLDILATGCQWRALPRDFPPRSTVQGYFYRWRDDHVWQRIVDHLVTLARTGSGRSAAPSVGIIDSQSVATAHGGGPRGLDAAKRIKGRKALLSEVEGRHIVTDTDGHLLAVHVHPANVRIATAPCRCSVRCAAAFPSCAISLPTASIAVTNSCVP